MDGQRTSNTDRAFGIKVDPGADDGEIDGVEVKDFYRTGVDINTADNWYVHDSSSEEAVTGNGFQSTDGTNMTYENITATTNGWGGVGVFTRGEFSGVPNTSDIVFQGSNTLEAVGKNADVYLEGFDEFDQANPTPITYSTNPLDGAEVTVQSYEVLFAYEGLFDDERCAGAQPLLLGSLHGSFGSPGRGDPDQVEGPRPGHDQEHRDGRVLPSGSWDPVDPGPVKPLRPTTVTVSRRVEHPDDVGDEPEPVDRSRSTRPTPTPSRLQGLHVLRAAGEHHRKPDRQPESAGDHVQVRCHRW